MPTYSVRLVCEAGPDPVSGEPRDAVEETLTVEAPTAWAAKTAATKRMTIRPMGRILRAYDAETGREIEPPQLGDLRPGRFRVDGLRGTYDGFTHGDTWNGFAVPYFPLAEARRIASDYSALPPFSGGQARSDYDADRDAIRLYDPASGEWDEVKATEVDDLSLYPVGARSWTWEEA